MSHFAIFHDNTKVGWDGPFTVNLYPEGEDCTLLQGVGNDVTITRGMSFEEFKAAIHKGGGNVYTRDCTV